MFLFIYFFNLLSTKQNLNVMKIAKTNKNKDSKVRCMFHNRVLPYMGPGLIGHINYKQQSGTL